MQQFLITIYNLVILVIIEFTLLLSGGILVLLVLGYKIVHVGFGLGELHFVHAFASIPMEERCICFEKSKEEKIKKIRVRRKRLR